MRALLLVLLLSGCSSLREGEYVGPFEGMAWKVECREGMLEDLAEKWEDNSPNYCDAELHEQGIDAYGMCAEWMRVRFRYEWAKAEYRSKCEREV